MNEILFKAIREGGNMSIAGEDGTEVMATKLQVAKMTPEQFEEFKTSFFSFLMELSDMYKERFGTPIWTDESLITKGKIYSGSTRAFFQKPFEEFTKYKKSVGDFDVQLPESTMEHFPSFVEELTGKTIGDFTFYGSRTKSMQSHSLVTANPEKFAGIGAEYMQFDWEYTQWDDEAGKPAEWNDVSHYSSWEDIENNVKGAFVKILLKAAVAVKSQKTDKPFYSIKTGKPVKTPADAKEYSFHVDNGVTHLLKDVNDGYAKLDIGDRTSSHSMDFLFEVLFDRKPEADEKRSLVSFVRLIKFMNKEYDDSLLRNIFTKFTKLLFDVHEQQISRDLTEDREVKHAAEVKFIELCPAVADMKDYAADAEEDYYTSEFRKEGNRYGQADKRAARLAAQQEGISFNGSHLKEEVAADGKTLYVYSSSKDQDLFKYYFGRNLKFGLNSGSAYGFATYAIMSDPFSGASDVGYSEAARDNLYGTNCFEFEIPTDKVFFFEYADYVKTSRGKNSTPADFVKQQVDFFKLPLSDEQIAKLTPEEGAEFSSKAAQSFFRYMSRIYYQDKLGALITPCAGFVYKGRNDGRTYVGWDGYALIPRRFTNDLGKTWKEVDRNSPEYKEYVEKANGEREAADVFDGHKTPLKEAVYRLFMKFGSGDDTADKLVDGLFTDIVIHDDKTVDCTFKSNLPYIDQDRHYLRLTNDNHLIRSLRKLGFKFGKLNAGIKIGKEALELYKDDLIESIDPSIWPDICTGGIKIAGGRIAKDTFQKIPTELGEHYAYIVNCQIDDDVLKGYELHGNPDKPNWTTGEETKAELVAAYGEFAENCILPEKPLPKAKRQLKNPDAIAKAEAKAKEKAEKEKADWERVTKNWDDDVEKAMKLTEAMAGKSHLPHLFNSGSSTQMKQKQFDELLNYIQESGNVFDEEHFNVSEKIDGSTTLFGVDEKGVFVEKFGMKEIYRPADLQREDLSRKVRAFLEIANNPELVDFLDDTRREYNMRFVKVQVEMLLTGASKHEDKSLMQIVLVPYKREKFAEEGGAFVVRVIGDDLQPLPGQEELLSAISSILTTPKFIVKPISDTDLDFAPIDLNEYIAEVLPTLNVKDRSERKAAYEDAQEKLQTLLTSHFPEGKYGEVYEGLVVTCNNGFAFKMTSPQFKEWMAKHNERKPVTISPDDPYGLVMKDFGEKKILLNHIGPGTELVGILIGHFAPFTGPKGHGRMIEELRSKGCKKFIVGIPDSTAEFDDDRAMYTVEQRMEIVNDYLKQEGLEGKAVKMRRGDIAITYRLLIWDVYNTFGSNVRPVYIVGPDRAELVQKNPEFDTDLNTTFPEKIVMSDRGEGNVSGTKVRELIRKGDVDGIAEMTGYSKQIAQKLVDLREDNLM